MTPLRNAAFIRDGIAYHGAGRPSTVRFQSLRNLGQMLHGAESQGLAPGPSPLVVPGALPAGHRRASTTRGLLRRALAAAGGTRRTSRAASRRKSDRAVPRREPHSGMGMVPSRSRGETARRVEGWRETDGRGGGGRKQVTASPCFARKRQAATGPELARWCAGRACDGAAGTTTCMRGQHAPGLKRRARGARRIAHVIRLCG